jgi:hypothetical protein
MYKLHPVHTACVSCLRLFFPLSDNKAGRNEKLDNKFIKFIFFTLLAAKKLERLKERRIYEDLIHFLEVVVSGILNEIPKYSLDEMEIEIEFSF